jgi:hypothetical protein
MKTCFILVTIALILVASPIVAEEKNKLDRTPPGNSATESAVPELANIVDLCAKDEEEKFKKEWSKYVSQNDLKGAELKKTISWVSDEAIIQRKKNKHMIGDESDDEAWKAERKKLMEELARQAKML